MKWNLFKWAGLMLAGAIIGCENDSGGIDWDFGTNDPNLYVCCGDSITEGGYNGSTTTYPSFLGAILGKTVVNQGYGGYVTSEGLGVVRSALSRYHPGYVLILFGANDVIHSMSSEDAVSNIRTMVQYAKAAQTYPVVSTCLPMIAGHSIFDGGVVYHNQLLRQMASEEGITLVDANAAFSATPELYIGADGLHPNEAGNQLLAQTFADAL